VAEALLQSHGGEISLLPALPTGWTNGSVTGLRARGGLEIGMHWRSGKLVSAQFRGGIPGLYQLRSGEKTVKVALRAGQTLILNSDLGSGDNAREQR
jgi:alpha-L-fucosidase 2